MSRYTPSRNYFLAAAVAAGLAAFFGWYTLDRAAAVIPAGLFLISAALLGFLALRPAIEVHEEHLGIGRREILWSEIRRVDRVGWISPLIVQLTLATDSPVLLIYPGDPDSANSLLRDVRWSATNALIDGVPYQQFWGEAFASVAERVKMPSPRRRFLREEDEAEVERLYWRLKSVGHLDSTNSADEK
jgi:hypothetical protein